jgi:putative transposase
LDFTKLNTYKSRKRFSFNIGFERMKASPQAISSSMQLYFTGESLRNVQKFLRLQGVSVSHVAVYKWIGKYTDLMQQYLSQITPQVSDTWRADELFVKIRGNMKYLFAVLDDETRFWIAQEVANSKETHDARQLFRAAKEIAAKKPKTLITDGLRTYQESRTKEFWTRSKATRIEHIRHIVFKGDHNNSKMERFNGEIRDREKVVRGLKKSDTPLLNGYQIYRNYIRPHGALDGKTPIEMAGIKIEVQDKWQPSYKTQGNRQISTSRQSVHSR